VKHRIEKIAAHLVKAQQQLTWNIDCWGLPLQELTIPNGLFSPPLPVGLLLRIGIENGDLSFSLYYLSKVKKPLSSVGDHPHTPPLTSLSSQTGLSLNGGGGGGLHLSASGGPVAHPSGSYLGYALYVPFLFLFSFRFTSPHLSSRLLSSRLVSSLHLTSSNVLRPDHLSSFIFLSHSPFPPPTFHSKLVTQGQQVVVEVSEQADVKCKVQTYTKVLEFLQKALQFCNEFIDKANALE
jgi:hypothetical protein